MPSFLSKLLGRKKTQEPDSFADKRGQPSSLLEGKFEAVSPNVSPSAAHFTDLSAAQIKGTDKPKDKDTPFHLFRTKSRPSSDSPTVEKAVPDVPHLSLNLPITKDRGQALDVVFESDPEAFALLNEAAIGERRLTPHETLSLCARVLKPSSSMVQHRLISLYLLSLASKSPTTTTLPTSPDSPAAFESELHYTCSPYDVAAVLRWGLRHLKLDGTSFGKGSGDWTWYNTFAEAERTNSYPLDAFSKSLIPQLPAIHSELLLAILDIISSLSARCEANGSSGSKLSKFFGLWLLTVEHSPEGDDWNAFYDRWDRAGRILEHLFLARIRDDAHRMPRRLTELVEHYPYPRGVEVLEDNLWPRSRFSTRDYDALFVRLDTEYTGVLKPRSHPLRLIADALRSQSATESATSEDSDLWETIKKASLASDTLESTSDTAPTEPIPVFSNVFSDETIRLFSLIPVDASNKDKTTPTFALHSPISPGRPRSFSLPESPRSPFQVEQGRASTFVHTHTPTDWLQFSSQGFGTTPGTRDLVATLWDNDVEVTTPPSMSLSRKSSRRAHSRRSSVDSPSAQTPVLPLPAVSAPLTSKTTLIAKVKVDEAFIDFWADALLDPISKPWPRFVLCQLKPLPFAVASTTPALTWLVIEQRFVRPASAPPSKEEVEGPTAQPRLRASSPRPSSRVESSRLSAAFSLAGDPKSPKELFSRLPQVGEFGEGMNETGRGAVAAAAEGSETEVKDGVKDRTGQDIAPAPTAIDAVAVATNDVAATVLLEPAGVPTLEGDKALKGQSNATDPPQNGLAHNGHHHDGGCKAEPKTTAHVPLDANGAMLPPALDEPVTTEAGLPAQEPGAEAGITRPTTEPSVTAPYFTGMPLLPYCPLLYCCCASGARTSLRSIISPGAICNVSCGCDPCRLEARCRLQSCHCGDYCGRGQPPPQDSPTVGEPKFSNAPASESESAAPALEVTVTTQVAEAEPGQAVPAELAPPACKDHPAAVTKGRAATLDGTAPTDAIPTVSGAAPAILLLRVNDGKAAAPTGVSRPIAIVEKETQVTATTALSGKAAVPPPESFDYPAVAHVEPGHATPTALPAGRGHPLRVTLEEQYTTTGPDLGCLRLLPTYPLAQGSLPR
ncbi:hypothetical protein B0F90DRAFT_1729691 [Multifurca ochricompacta]|uniref:Meiotically up-regulated protein Msb1/Mug8 domain-containing protein n=1 Tax=Multifurca ochricompacta TaxID=376703 RepID=A0AAD4M441_9AGAM|nr:hypothetical protein B0F90DRAFT_1729691 [Multifurca ochricompacta]